MKAKRARIFGVAVVFTLAVGVAGTTSAADLRGGDGSQYANSTLIVPASESVRNLYAAAPQVVVDASSTKDTVAAGGTVEVDGATADDLTVAGGTVEVRGAVGGSARVAGGNVAVDSAVKEDLVVAGGNVTVSPTASVGGDLIVAGGTVVVDGPVAGNVRVIGGELVINSKVGGDVAAKLNDLLQLGPLANVAGSVAYTAPVQLAQDPAAHVAGSVTFAEGGVQHDGRWLWLFILALALKVLAEILAAYVLFAVFRQKFERLVAAVSAGFWKNAGYGFLFAVAVPVASVILFFTVIGYYVAIIALAGYALAVMAAWLVAGAWFGSWLASKVKRHVVGVGYGTIALGVALATLLTAVPFVGWLFGAVLLLAGFGAVARNVRSV